jgi:uncharacterized protein YjbI with pentapeptide repeats
LSKANLTDAKLVGANLTEIQALSTNFTGAQLTRACLENWTINSTTQLDDVICDYVYLQHHQQERCPSSGNFGPGEFTKLFQDALSTFDLVFPGGIDWLAFAHAFQQIEQDNSGARLAIRSIESKGDGELVVRVIVACDVDKTQIQTALMETYATAKTDFLPSSTFPFHLGQRSLAEAINPKEDLNQLLHLLRPPASHGRFLGIRDRRLKLRRLSRPRIMRYQG